jgi:hypothetical protein
MAGGRRGSRQGSALGAMTAEYLGGRRLGSNELDTIKRELEAMDRLEVISDDLRAIVMRQRPHLTSKVPPE